MCQRDAHTPRRWQACTRARPSRQWSASGHDGAPAGRRVGALPRGRGGGRGVLRRACCAGAGGAGTAVARRAARRGAHLRQRGDRRVGAAQRVSSGGGAVRRGGGDAPCDAQTRGGGRSHKTTLFACRVPCVGGDVTVDVGGPAREARRPCTTRVAEGGHAVGLSARDRRGARLAAGRGRGDVAVPRCGGTSRWEGGHEYFLVCAPPCAILTATAAQRRPSGKCWCVNRPIRAARRCALRERGAGEPG